MDANNNPDFGNDMSHHLSPHQIQQLEAYFRRLPHPDENQRSDIARQLGLDLSQVTSWFHNTRNQRVALHPPVENNALRTESHSMHDDIQAFSEVVNNVICTDYGGYPPVRDKEKTLKHTPSIPHKISILPFWASHIRFLFPKMQENLLKELTSRAARELLGQQSESSSIGPDVSLMNSQNLKAASRSIFIGGMDIKKLMIHIDLALSELVVLSTTNEPLWVKSGTNRGYVLCREEYSKRFPNSNNITSTRFRFESSKDSILVPLKASDLAGMFLDMNQWADLFPTIVKEAKISKALDTETFVGSLHLMYGRMHILSPLLVPREFIFLRYCVQQCPYTWYIVDVTYDCLINTQAKCPTLSWRFPSGVMIQSLPDARSMVTWVEHVQVNASPDHPLYEHLLSTSHGYGATRWLSSLYRMTERSLYSVIPRSTSFSVLEGRKNIKTFSLRMIRDFCSILTMPENLSGSSNPYFRMTVRNNNERGQPNCIVAATTSVWLPLTFKDLFNFLRDKSMRPKWDVMNNRSPVRNITQFPTGTNPGNYISVLQTSFMKERNMCLLQESSIDLIDALVIFTPINLPKMMEIAIGADTSNIPLLPCGFLISNDGRPDRNGSDGASTSTGTTSRLPGSLLTLAFQWVLQDISESRLNEAVDNLNYILTSTIQCIRVALNCT